MEILAFNFAIRTFAYKRLGQGLSRPVSPSSCFMREYLDPTIVKADQCAQNVVDLGLAAENFLDKLRFPNSKKALQRYRGFVNSHRNFIRRTAEKLNPFYNMLKTDMPIKITSELKGIFYSVNKILSDACELTLKQPIPRKQLTIMTDASFKNAGYAPMTEDNPDPKIQSKWKT